MLFCELTNKHTIHPKYINKTCMDAICFCRCLKNRFFCVMSNNLLFIRICLQQKQRKKINLASFFIPNRYILWHPPHLAQILMTQTCLQRGICIDCLLNFDTYNTKRTQSHRPVNLGEP